MKKSYYHACIHLNFGMDEGISLVATADDSAVVEVIQAIKKMFETQDKKAFNFDQYHYPTSVEAFRSKNGNKIEFEIEQVLLSGTYEYYSPEKVEIFCDLVATLTSEDWQK